MFQAFLSQADDLRVSLVREKLSACGFSGALTGGVATELQFLAQGRVAERRVLNDLDFVVESSAAIPDSLAHKFLVHHVHPDAAEGRLLLQLIDREQRLRVDLFRPYGATLARAGIMEAHGLAIRVISLEDLVARTTSLVVGELRRGQPIEIKHALTFRRLSVLGDPAKLDVAWSDHRESETGSFSDAVTSAHRLFARHRELVIPEDYSREVVHCPRCRDRGPFQRARPDLIVDVLGYF